MMVPQFGATSWYHEVGASRLIPRRWCFVVGTTRSVLRGFVPRGGYHYVGLWNVVSNRPDTRWYLTFCNGRESIIAEQSQLVDAEM